MIGRINGILLETALTEIMVDVGGIGYIIRIPMSTYDKLPRPGEKVSVLTYLHVRENAIQLYGFATEEEKQLFELLISVSGIGVNLALNVLSSMAIPTFCSAVSSGDTKMISRIKGLGKKTAERTVLELKEKIKSIASETVAGAKVPEPAKKASEEAVLALVQLGFKYETAWKNVHEIVKELPPEESTPENLIRLTLRSMNR